MDLKFKNGKFRIMQIADVQDTNKTSPDTLRLLRLCLEREKPDLVVFTGDQIKGYGFNFSYGDRKAKVKTAIDNILSVIDEAGVPFTFVFGNHDCQAFSASKQEQLEMYKAHKNCLAYNADDEIDGYCNHNLTVLNSEGKAGLNIYLIDSLSMSASGVCEAVKESQLNWYRETRERLKEENGGYVPSVVFQHIPVPEIYELLKEVEPNTENSCRGYKEHDGKYFIINPEAAEINPRSFMGETPSIPAENSGEFDAWCEKGEVVGAFFGHDHNNSFIGELNGIKLGYTQGCGFNVYGPGLRRGVRILEFYESSADFSTYTLTAEDLEDFSLAKPLKYVTYTYSPSSVDMAKPLIAKGAALAAGAALLGVGIKLLKKHNK